MLLLKFCLDVIINNYGIFIKDVVFVCSPTLSLPISDQLFMQSPKGQVVLQHVKEFMRKHILPAQKVSTAVSCVENPHESTEYRKI